MKKFVPYYDGVLDQLLPEDHLVPYQVGWAEFVALPDDFEKRVARRNAIGGEVPTDHPVSSPTDLPYRR